MVDSSEHKYVKYKIDYPPLYKNTQKRVMFHIMIDFAFNSSILLV